MHMADPETYGNALVEGRTYRPKFTKEQSMKVIVMCVRLLNTFSPLFGFKRFTMHLALPWGWDQTGYHRPSRTHQLFEAHEKKCVHVQEFLGRRFLGEKSDPVSRDSNRESNSQWEELTWTKYEVCLS